MKAAALILVLVLLGCSSSDGFYVILTSSTIENRNQRIVGINGGPCDHIKIGDKAVLKGSGDTVFWLNDQPYNVRMVQAK
jgi:hypothetical protein